jgi:hypothetical protein
MRGETRRPKIEDRRKTGSTKPLQELNATFARSEPTLSQNERFATVSRISWLSARTFGFRICLTLVAASARAAEDLAESNSLPALRPPRPELPPSFWEQYGAWAIAGGILAALVVVALILYVMRPKPVAVEPPQIVARRSLEDLRGRPEDGNLLSRVSQVLRHYIAAAFSLPPGEMTTAEFKSAIAGREEIGSELSQRVGDFLRECDERKFAPLPRVPPPLPEKRAAGAVSRALELVGLAEGRKAALAEAARNVAQNRE